MPVDGFLSNIVKSGGMGKYVIYMNGSAEADL